MSEYQYYEFQAIDRPLTQKQMAEIRAITTRATITPTRFVNEYTWGDFKGDPRAMIEQYYDAFLYVANWGTHWFILRFPCQLLALEAAASYCGCEGASVRQSGEHLILEFISEDHDREFEDDVDADQWLPSLLPLRAELAGGDLRVLYLGWLSCAQAEMLDDDEIEPPVPPGLKQLPASLSTFADFLRIDEDLLITAAASSADPDAASPSTADLERLIRLLPGEEKDTLLIRAARGEAPHLQAELLQRARAVDPAARPRVLESAPRRTVAGLLERAEQRSEARRREEAERKAREQAQREQEQASRRAAYLDSLMGREDAMWQTVEALVESKKPGNYDTAVRMLVDLRDLSNREGSGGAFAGRVAELRGRHARKPALVERLDRAGLQPGKLPSEPTVRG
jgi:hypothetical protein